MLNNLVARNHVTLCVLQKRFHQRWIGPAAIAPAKENAFAFLAQDRALFSKATVLPEGVQRLKLHFLIADGMPKVAKIRC